jgi:hypothetical protein
MSLLPSAKVASDAFVALAWIVAVLGIIRWVVRYVREFFARHWVSDASEQRQQQQQRSILKKKR